MRRWFFLSVMGVIVGCGSTSPALLCGNGEVDSGETCDDGTVADDGCTNACQLPACGDGLVQTGEACDDANVDDTDQCLSTCALASVGMVCCSWVKPVMTAIWMSVMRAPVPVRRSLR